MRPSYDPNTISFKDFRLANCLASSGYSDIIWIPATEIKSPVFPFSKIIPQFKYLTAWHQVIPKAPHCRQGPLSKVSAVYVSHMVHTCEVHSLGSRFCCSFLLKNIPTPMLILYLFSSNLDSLVLFHSYISCSVDRSLYLFWSFRCKTNRNTTF